MAAAHSGVNHGWLFGLCWYFLQGILTHNTNIQIKKALKPIKVTVLNNNLRAISLYKSNGFKIISKSKGKIPITEVEATVYKMEKII